MFPPMEKPYHFHIMENINSHLTLLRDILSKKNDKNNVSIGVNAVYG